MRALLRFKRSSPVGKRVPTILLFCCCCCFFLYFVHDCKILGIIKLLIFWFCFVSRDPNGSDSPVTWPKFSKVNRSYLALDVKPKEKQKYRAKEMEFWNSLIPKVIRQTKGQKGKLCSGAAKQPFSSRRL